MEQCAIKLRLETHDDHGIEAVQRGDSPAIEASESKFNISHASEIASRTHLSFLLLEIGSSSSCGKAYRS